MKILGVDPGSEQSAWCELVDGAPRATDKIANAELLELLRRDHFAPSFLAIEMIASYGMPVGREVFETCLWIGRFVEAWERGGGDSDRLALRRYRLVYRREVKLLLCESNRANDANIRAALIDRFGPGRERAIGTKRAPGPLYGVKGDAWSALAVALTAAGTPAPAPLFRETKAAALAEQSGEPPF